MSVGVVAVLNVLWEFVLSTLSHFTGSVAAHSITGRRKPLPGPLEVHRASPPVSTPERQKVSTGEERAGLRKSYKEEAALRLNTVLGLLNEGAEYNKLTIPEIGRTVGMQKVGELERYFEGTDEPPRNFMDLFQRHYGVSADWLDLGKGSPFPPSEFDSVNTLGLVDKILALQPRTLFFVRN